MMLYTSHTCSTKRKYVSLSSYLTMVALGCTIVCSRVADLDCWRQRQQDKAPNSTLSDFRLPGFTKLLKNLPDIRSDKLSILAWLKELLSDRIFFPNIYMYMVILVKNVFFFKDIATYKDLQHNFILLNKTSVYPDWWTLSGNRNIHDQNHHNQSPYHTACQ
jgi:hypothetical protein